MQLFVRFKMRVVELDLSTGKKASIFQDHLFGYVEAVAGQVKLVKTLPRLNKMSKAIG